MTEALITNKICIDSRFRTENSQSDTDFSIELPESITFPPGTVCMVTDICIPNAWYTIESGVNDRLYFRYEVYGVRYDNVIFLTEGNYNLTTLADEIEQKLLALTLTHPTFQPSVDIDETKGNLKISTTFDDPGTFYFLPDRSLKMQSVQNSWIGQPYSTGDPQSANNIISNRTFVGYNKDKPFVSGFIDTLTHHTIYIKCAQLGTFQNIGPQGERDILKKVVVTVPFGQLITDNTLNTDDFTDCSRQNIRQLKFRVTDIKNNTLNLHGQHVSFSLVFKTL
jgi:hypothetical protein